ncbi:2-C-methyl-D-erythritol 4-phosphate cytidylyltransferase [Prosthecochloris sp.]|uniref:2-C-methyl-D-erythritol 4-phosphate cytidylyltransferase n=1 Tax=Prosthecochloris sp. TaxID=290513 RepID=UPI0025E12F0E|nr:2-C-methyl-D-erythritol 4-phosphate cytidylyltransferase [Prosthecochloris sp.]
MSSYAIIAASGIGKRMKLQKGQSKQLLEIGGYPVIYHTLSAFEQADSIDTVFIATKPESIGILESMKQRYGFSKIESIIPGGKERQDSIFNCIDLIEKQIASTGESPEAILVHDGARPFIQSWEIDDIVSLATQYGACVPATKPKDTIKYIADNPDFFGETLDRSRLLQVQTPQGFASKTLIQAHKHARLEQCYATDDAALVEKFFPEQNIKIYEMGYHNIKITTPEDVHLAEAIHTKLRIQQKTQSPENN